MKYTYGVRVFEHPATLSITGMRIFAQPRADKMKQIKQCDGTTEQESKACVAQDGVIKRRADLRLG